MDQEGQNCEDAQVNSAHGHLESEVEGCQYPNDHAADLPHEEGNVADCAFDHQQLVVLEILPAVDPLEEPAADQRLASTATQGLTDQVAEDGRHQSDGQVEVRRDCSRQLLVLALLQHKGRGDADKKTAEDRGH